MTNRTTAILLTIFTALLLTLSPLAAYAACWYDQDGNAHCGSGPVYYQVLSEEPDWCTYSGGDVVYVHSHSENETFMYDSWYVCHPASVHGVPSGYDGPWYVDNTFCTIFVP